MGNRVVNVKGNRGYNKYRTVRSYGSKSKKSSSKSGGLLEDIIVGGLMKMIFGKRRRR